MRKMTLAVLTTVLCTGLLASAPADAHGGGGGGGHGGGGGGGHGGGYGGYGSDLLGATMMVTDISIATAMEFIQPMDTVRVSTGPMRGPIPA